jgi:hypothetical protein
MREVPNDPARAILAALIAGLESLDTELQQRCSAALRAIGGRCRPLLYEAAHNPRSSIEVQWRLLETYDDIGERDEYQPTANAAVCGALLAMLLSSSKRRSEFAFEALRHLGSPAVDAVIQQALIQRRNPRRCSRLLRLGQRLGHHPTLEGWNNLLLIANLTKAETSELARSWAFQGLPAPNGTSDAPWLCEPQEDSRRNKTSGLDSGMLIN